MDALVDDLDARLGWLEEDAATYRQMLSVSLEQRHADLRRVAQLEGQLQALREELRRYTAAQASE